MIKAVIFDFDGVIGDTMADNCVAWQKAFAVHGVSIVPSEYYKLEGMGRFQIADLLIEKYALDPVLRSKIVEDKEQNYKENNTFKLYEGVHAIFDLLRENEIPIAIVTGASRERITEHLDKNIEKSLTALVTADDVTHTKPNPEPYLSAISKLNRRPENCLVIENAILGIRSAKAAGCLCYALETTLGRDELKEADEIFAGHDELLIKLKSLF